MKTFCITFRSVTPAQRGERALRQGGIDCVLQRTPRRMEERGCGYCLRLRAGEIQSALERLHSSGVTYSKVYTLGENGTVEEAE